MKTLITCTGRIDEHPMWKCKSCKKDYVPHFPNNRNCKEYREFKVITLIVNGESERKDEEPAYFYEQPHNENIDKDDKEIYHISSKIWSLVRICLNMNPESSLKKRKCKK